MRYYGWDISTAIIGFCLFDDDKYVESKYLDLRKLDGLIEKSDAAHEWIKTLSEELSAKTVTSKHVIEDKLSGFSGGGSNAGTVMKLAAFNATVTWMIHDRFFRDEIIHMHPSTVKAVMKRDGLVIPKGADKKQLTLDFVVVRNANFPLILNKNSKPQPYCYDMADAYITARSGFLRGQNVEETKKSTDV